MAYNPHLEDAKKNATSFKELKFNTGAVFLRWFLLSPKSLVDFQVSVDISPTYCPNFDSEFCSVFSSVAQSCPTLCDPMNRSTPGLPVHHQLRSPPKPMSIESVMPSNHLILFRPRLLLTSIFAPYYSIIFSSFSSHLQSFPASGSFPMSQLSSQVAKVLEFQLQHQSFQ